MLKIVLVLMLVGASRGGVAVHEFDYAFQSVEQCEAVGKQYSEDVIESSGYPRVTPMYTCLVVPKKGELK